MCDVVFQMIYFKDYIFFGYLIDSVEFMFKLYLIKICVLLKIVFCFNLDVIDIWFFLYGEKLILILVKIDG